MEGKAKGFDMMDAAVHWRGRSAWLVRHLPASAPTLQPDNTHAAWAPSPHCRLNACRPCHQQRAFCTTENALRTSIPRLLGVNVKLLLGAGINQVHNWIP